MGVPCEQGGRFSEAPGGSLHGSLKTVGGIKRFCKPATIQEQIDARAQGIALNPRTGEIIGSIMRPSDLDSQIRFKTQQDKLFAEQFGATAAALSAADPGDPFLASLTHGIVGGSSVNPTFLRADQIQALLALKGKGAAANALSGLTGKTIASVPMPSKNFGGSGSPGGGFGGTSVDGPSAAAAPNLLGKPFLLLGVAAALLLLFARR